MEIPGEQRKNDNNTRTNWRESLLALISARLALIELESKEAATNAARRAILIVALIACVLFTWALMLVGGIACLAHFSGWPWYGIAGGVAILHLVAALLFARAAQSPTAPTFPVTRAEFKKDREWIKNFQQTRKSDD